MSVVISAKIESEIAMLPPDERVDYLAAVGLNETGSTGWFRPATRFCISSLISPPAEGGARLDHHAGDQAPQAAGVIHTDFEKGFIRARDDQLRRLCRKQWRDRRQGSAKDALEGKDYVVADGDVMHFRFAT